MELNTGAFRKLGPQELLRVIVEEAQRIPIAEYENEAAAKLRVELVPEVRDLALEMLRVIEPLIDPDRGEESAEARHGGSASAFARRVDALIRDSDAVDHIGDLAFMARVELRSKLCRLGDVAELDSWELIGRCGSCLRKVIKAATALDLVLGDCTGIHHLSFETELETSLQVRRVYGKFRRHLLDFEPSEEAGSRVEQQLNNAATAIARLIGRDVYLDLRVTDRVELRNLQGRLIDWTTRSRHDARAGQRLLEDIRAFVELLAQVNHRQELREHDQRIVPGVLDELAQHPGTESVPAELRGTLERLYGLEDELDRRLQGRIAVPIDAVRTVLERLEAALPLPAW